MSARPLLIELFTEELPPKALERLGDAFALSVFEGLRSRVRSPRRTSTRATRWVSRC